MQSRHVRIDYAQASFLQFLQLFNLGIADHIFNDFFLRQCSKHIAFDPLLMAFKIRSKIIRFNTDPYRGLNRLLYIAFMYTYLFFKYNTKCNILTNNIFAVFIRENHLCFQINDIRVWKYIIL